MEQQIAELLRQNQELIRALQIRDHSSSHKVTVQFEKFDEENENFDSLIERFETYLDVQNVPIANRAKGSNIALKGRVENEIDRLEREGIMEKVESSEWATPIIHSNSKNEGYS
ncbi:retrovirus-related Pol polyprotein from transposon 17.6 [Trichonephila clavata]|uniref:Retrovirus-related Pol polyprotein from transposon 17.6 n=1 Tax=Trichonephila clavata TaxID=2740835 RepID=A0A8X6GEA0_TRICU|nr:retrovirus-related Pol polyprotein from transposon 17.6 [Trichonephila clavata]